MFELPEFVNLAAQISRATTDAVIKQGRLGNAPHKFVGDTDILFRAGLQHR